MNVRVDETKRDIVVNRFAAVPHRTYAPLPLAFDHPIARWRGNLV
jgi:hypothetical protein